MPWRQFRLRSNITILSSRGDSQSPHWRTWSSTFTPKDEVMSNLPSGENFAPCGEALPRLTVCGLTEEIAGWKEAIFDQTGYQLVVE